MTVPSYARKGRTAFVTSLTTPVYAHAADARGRVDLDALKAAGLNSDRHSQVLLAKHRAAERARMLGRRDDEDR